MPSSASRFLDRCAGIFVGLLCAQLLGGAPPVDAAIGSPALYQYFPHTSLAIGKGFDPNDLTDSKVICTQRGLIHDIPQGINSQLRTFIATSAEGVRQAEHVDAHLEAHYAFAKADVKSSYDTAAETNTNSIYVVFEIHADYPGQDLQAPSVGATPLTKDYDTLEKTKKSEFIKTCGTKLVTQVDRESAVYAVFEVHDSDGTLHNEFTANVNLSVGYGPVGGTLETNLKNTLDRTISETNRQIHVDTIGGLGVNAFAELATAEKDPKVTVAAITTAMAHYLDKFKDNPSVTVYHVTTMPGLSESDVTFSPAKDDALQVLINRNRSAESLSADLNDLVQAQWADDIPSQDKKRYGNERTDIAKYQKAIEYQHRKCLDAQPPQLSECTPPNCKDYAENAASECGNAGVEFIRPAGAPPKYYPSTVQLRAVVDDVLLSPSQSREIFDVHAPTFTQRVQTIKSSAKSAYAVLIFTNPYLSTIRETISLDALGHRHEAALVPDEAGASILHGAKPLPKPSFWHQDWPGDAVFVLEHYYSPTAASSAIAKVAGGLITLSGTVTVPPGDELGPDVLSLLQYAEQKSAGFVTWNSHHPITYDYSKKSDEQRMPPTGLRLYQTGSIWFAAKDRGSPTEVRVAVLNFNCEGPPWDEPPQVRGQDAPMTTRGTLITNEPLSQRSRMTVQVDYDIQTYPNK